MRKESKTCCKFHWLKYNIWDSIGTYLAVDDSLKFLVCENDVKLRLRMITDHLPDFINKSKINFKQRFYNWLPKGRKRAEVVNPQVHRARLRIIFAIPTRRNAANSNIAGLLHGLIPLAPEL